MGLERVRLTGGEPLVRRGLVDLVGMLSAIDGIEDILPLIEETLRTKPERHNLVQGSGIGSGGLVALSQTGG